MELDVETDVLVDDDEVVPPCPPLPDKPVSPWAQPQAETRATLTTAPR
ncbi:Hypothetical protein A7982_02916 [Minicystis rosea]|nr:Hypothetical protein A7982_02916 [Minicystis rosea]